jgi:hypothetical protein
MTCVAVGDLDELQLSMPQEKQLLSPLHAPLFISPCLIISSFLY